MNNNETIEMKLHCDNFMAIDREEKTVELRLFDTKRQSLTLKSIILFSHERCKEDFLFIILFCNFSIYWVLGICKI